MQYGTKAKATEIQRFLKHILQNNELQNKKVPVCIWGNHGIGKTELVKDFAKANRYEFIYIAPAQFEEMGDLLGMPTIENGKTTFAAPSWVPTSKNKGILLIDDVNRADDRILRGIMQLLQNFELVSWKLPKNWHIVLTANPDSGDYSVTPMDDAMLTRMLHISMVFDVNDWANWAMENDVHQDGINFVLTHPEVLNGNRTTARTLVQFFQNIETIDNWKSNLSLIQLIGDATLDESAVNSFINFIQNDRQLLISPNEIINTTNFKKEIETPLTELVSGTTLRIDILATICTRLMQNVSDETLDFSDLQLENIKQFMKLNLLPNDLRLTLAQDLVQSKNKHLKKIIADPVIGKLILQIINL
jgi:hypothetical protein